MAGGLPVFVVHWNAPDWAAATTASFLASTVPTCVTVIDNGPDGVPLMLDPRVRVLRSGANLGYAGGANLGIAQWLERDADAEFCVVACHDVTLEPATLERLLAVAAARPEYGVLAPEPAAGIASGKHLGGDVPGVVNVAWASGTCLLLRRTCIEGIGPFDETFGSYGEDQDLCLRATEAGWKVGLVTGAPAIGQGSVDPSFRAQMYVNQVRLRAKHAGVRAAARMTAAFPALALLDASRWVVSRDDMFRHRAESRARAVPAAARLVWQRARAHNRSSRGRRGDGATAADKPE
jgi:N-acetylglucosaminyl-diphospho-decaprenol L-rhamnosyltransferase